MTDLERSTELLARLGDSYASLIADVRRLVRAAVRSAGGHQVDSRGDDFLAVFERAPAALAAAISIQGGMDAGPWPDGNEVRLRIGVHGGRPTLTDHGYVGLSVHAVARICFAGHGGQVLLSRTVHDAVAESLDETVSVTGLGPWRFEGLPEPIEIYQADAAGRVADFPPLRLGNRVTVP
jgi:class 3 adenylate cyclase